MRRPLKEGGNDDVYTFLNSWQFSLKLTLNEI